MGSKISIGVVFEGELNDGGGFQTQLSSIIQLKKNKNFLIKAFVFSKDNKNFLKLLNIESVIIKNSIFERYFRFLNRQEWFYKISTKFHLKSFFEKELATHNIDLVYFLSPSSLALDLTTHNYIFTVWDSCHRDNPEFPEVNHFRTFENREYLYFKALTKAIAVLTDSELGRENLIRRYGLDKDRVYSASFAPSINVNPSNFIDIKRKYKIIGDYVFYPAQFWAHKNHIYIVDSIKILKEKGILLSAIFSGSDKGNLDYVLNYAKKNGVEDLIKYIGFAPNEEIYYLYKQSLGLVMPTYFGPTNIPPLEAFRIGTPVFYSNLEGLKDQVGDAAILCDLTNPYNLAEELILIKDKGKRKIIIDKGFKRLEELKQNLIDEKLILILNKYSAKLKCWKN